MNLTSIFASWKTSSAGVGGLITVAYNIYTNKAISASDVSMIIASIGLLSAKDGDVTGGTKTQPTVENFPTLVEKK